MALGAGGVMYYLARLLDNLPASAETREAKWLPLSNCHCSWGRKLGWS